MAKGVSQARRWKGGSRVEPPLYKLSANDQWCNETRQRLARAMGRFMRQANLLHRQFQSLSDAEAEAIVEAITVEYADARAERYDAEEAAEKNPSPDRLPDLIGI